MSLRTWLIGGLILYFVVLLLVAFVNNRNTDRRAYFLNSNKTPYWILATAFVAAWFGGNSALISVDESFSQGFGGWWVLGGPTVVAVIVMYFFARPIRRLGLLTQNGIVTERYNQTAGNFLSVLFILFFITWGASQMVAVGNFLAPFIDTSYLVAVVVAVAISLVYSALGGFRGVVMTEMIQFFLLTAGLLVITIVALGNSGGLDAITHSPAASDSPNYFNLITSFPANLAYIVGFSLAFIIDGSIWQRLSASRNPNEARKATGLALIIFIPLFAFVSITGVAAAGMFDTLPENGIVTTIITDHLPASVGALVFVGVAAAIMSTMCTALHASALYMSELYEKYVQPDLSNKGSVRVGIVMTVIACALGFVVAIRLQDALAVLSIASNILAAGAFVPVMGGFVWRRATSSGAIACMIGGGGFVLYDYLGRLGLPLPTFWQEESTAIILGVVIGLVLYVGVSLVSKPQTDKHEAFIRSAGIKEGPEPAEAAEPAVDD